MSFHGRKTNERPLGWRFSFHIVRIFVLQLPSPWGKRLRPLVDVLSTIFTNVGVPGVACCEMKMCQRPTCQRLQRPLLLLKDPAVGGLLLARLPILVSSFAAEHSRPSKQCGIEHEIQTKRSTRTCGYATG